MADQLGLEMVMEGVETEAQAELLKKMGCRIAQGFSIIDRCRLKNMSVY